MSFKRATVVMLPTNEKAPIIKGWSGDVLYLTSSFKQFDENKDTYHHLYITSDDEIKELP